jgi:hypothetical protein
MKTMEWEYFVEEVPQNSNHDDIEKLLADLGDGGWELTTSLTLPGDPHVNSGAARTYLLCKRPARKS